MTYAAGTATRDVSTVAPIATTQEFASIVDSGTVENALEKFDQTKTLGSQPPLAMSSTLRSESETRNSSGSSATNATTARTTRTPPRRSVAAGLVARRALANRGRAHWSAFTARARSSVTTVVRTPTTRPKTSVSAAAVPIS